MTPTERYAEWLTGHARLVILVLVVATLAVGSAAGDVDSGLSIASFSSDSTEAQKLDYVERNFTTGGENRTALQVIYRGGDALSKESLLAELRLQEAIYENETVSATLAGERSAVGLSNLVAIAAIQAERGGGPPGDGATDGQAPSSDGETDSKSSGSEARPSLDEQRTQLESMSQAEIEGVLERLLAGERRAAAPVDPYVLLPTSFDRESMTDDARVMFVFQETPGSNADSLPENVAAGQLAVRDLADRDRYDGPGEAFVFGAGIVDEEAGQATGDSFALITPFALVFIVGILLVAYRDLVDVVLALVGVVLVLVWMAGVMGWVGIGVTQILIAVPFLLVGLSIDYALHVVMRYREARADDPALSPRSGMARGLVGTTVALAATTFTTAVGFLANITSPIQSIQSFGAVAAAGIVSAFLVFAVLLPAVKLEVDGLLERAGLDRRKRAFGRSGAAARALGVGASFAKRAPAVVVVVGLVLAAGGGYAATDIETSIDQVDFLPRDSPEWMESLPGPFAPGDYHVREHAVYVNDNFLQSRDRAQVQILVEGSVTDPSTLDRLRAGERAVANSSTAVTLADGRPRVTSVLSVIEETAADNESFAALVRGADIDGDGVPDRNLQEVYDGLYAAAPEDARSVLYRADGEYRALRVQVAVRGGADSATVTAQMRDVAGVIEGDGETESARRATATGQPVIQEVVQQGLLRTLVQGFLLTLGVILAFLVVIFKRRYDAPALGVVTTVPVVFALAWILGAMYLFDVAFNTETAIITSIAIGLGVDYAIHVSERFLDEFRESGDAEAALDRTIVGTGGALLASALTTASGFGVLVLALVPSLRRFGLVTGTTIVFAFLASVLVLPSLLRLWVGWSDAAVAAPAPAKAD
jgi:predicted RND superfamily exporter protein